MKEYFFKSSKLSYILSDNVPIAFVSLAGGQDRCSEWLMQNTSNLFQTIFQRKENYYKQQHMAGV
jgi:hypothetical protein